MTYVAIPYPLEMDNTKGSLKKELEYNDHPVGLNYIIMGEASVTHEQTLTHHIWRLLAEQQNVLSAGGKREESPGISNSHFHPWAHSIHTLTHRCAHVECISISVAILFRMSDTWSCDKLFC